MSKEEHFLFCEALSGKPTRKDEIGKVSTAAGILIHYHPNSGCSKLKCPFLDYDSREHDQLMQFVIPWFFLFFLREKKTVTRREKTCGQDTRKAVIWVTYLERLQVNFKHLFNDL